MLKFVICCTTTNITILNYNELKSYLLNSKSDFTLLAISGYKSLNYLDPILTNTQSLGLVSKEAIVSAGHLFKGFTKKIKKTREGKKSKEGCNSK